MNTNMLEALIGGVVLCVAAFFVYFAYSSTEWRGSSESYELSAKFDRIDGLSRGNDVRLSGVKIGNVTDLTIDPESYLAVVKVSVDPKIQLPKDSSAEIVSDGLLGGKYVSLVPGAEDAMIPAGGQIEFTQASVSLESLIGQFMFSNKDEDKKDAAPSSSPKNAL